MSTSQTNVKPRIDVAEFIFLLHGNSGEYFEIRVLGCPQWEGSSKLIRQSGFFRDPERAAKAITEIEKLKPQGIYVSLNPVSSETASKCFDRIKQAERDGTTSDDAILRRRWLLIDIDPLRTANTSSTKSEMQFALDKAERVANDLAQEGWPEPIRAMSGNGATLLYRIDLPNNEAAKVLVERCLVALSAQYSDKIVNIDTTTFNASRISKVCGTVARKGSDFHPDDEPEERHRRHRRSWFVMPEQPIEVVTELELEELAASYVPPKEPDLRQKHQSDFSLDRWIQERNVPVGNPIPYRGGRKWIFESLPIPCQSSPSGHECDGSGAIFEASDGKIGAVCQHDRCRWNWKELREAYEPGCYAKYENYGSQIVEDGNLGPDEEDDRVDASRVDPETEAANVLQSHQHLGFNRLIFWGGGFLYWTKGKFVPIPNSEARTIIVKSLNERFTGVGTSVVSDVLEQVRAASLLSIQVQPPSWLTKNEWKPEDVIATENAIVHLPTLSEGSTTYTTPSTPSFFTTSALDYDFDDSKPDCANWKSFINQLWPGDQDCIDTLQEWFGYCLTPDTRQQKILMMLGPKRSGKGTICRVLRSVVGDGNVCGPTLASLQTNFGLWPLLGKTVAIVSDARLSGRSDQAVITERLLSISGEDAQTIDRKNMEPVTTKLSTRFMIVSNELPRLQDSSGAFTGRMIVLRLSESFYGREDQQLSDRLMDEREGILHWAIDGWKRLRERSHFVQPESGMELVQQLNELASPILSFVEDRCEVDDCYTITVQDLYLGWCEWCKEVGREPTTTQTFGRDLSALLPRLRLRQTRIGAHRVRTYDGIRLTESRF